MTGASFDSLAARYNTDPAADKAGDLGWLRVEELPDFFQEVLDESQTRRREPGAA